jgi:hypothetical protein
MHIRTLMYAKEHSSACGGTAARPLSIVLMHLSDTFSLHTCSYARINARSVQAYGMQVHCHMVWVHLSAGLFSSGFGQKFGFVNFHAFGSLKMPLLSY